MQIKHFQHKEIDFQRWDATISESTNRLTYAFSWYLDLVSPGWEALIADDYEYLMPLPVKRKYYVNYIVQPFLTQQLGIFSKHRVTENTLNSFIKKIPYYSYELHLNEKNEYPEIALLPNYILYLNKPYSDLTRKYSKNTARNIEKAQKQQLNVCDETDAETFLAFYTSVSIRLKKSHLDTIRKVLKKAVEKKALEFYTVKNTNGEIIASLALLINPGRLTYFLPASDAEGKKKSAMFLLVDYLIRKNAESGLIFDFEGSAIEGIARFYKGFGAENKPYYSLKRFRPSFLVGKFSEKK